MKFKNMKFDVAGKPELSEIIQRMLFELAYIGDPKGLTNINSIAAWNVSESLTYGEEPTNCLELASCELTTLPELAKILQEHYDSQDIVRVGDVLEVELVDDDLPEFKFHLVVEAQTSEVRTVSLENGSLWCSDCVFKDTEDFSKRVKEYIGRRIVKNHGPLKDLNIQRLLGASSE